MAFTYFFRDYQTLEMIVHNVIPGTIGSQHIRVWDAGCAMGPEPYSIAIMFAENMGKFAFKNLRIHATDIDGSNLFGQIISRGVYPDEQVKRIPKEIFNKYFTPDKKEGSYVIDYRLRKCVEYTRHNLLSLKPVSTDYNLVVCKNVLLHFKQHQRVDVMKMYHRVLIPGGFLAMEQTQKLPNELKSFFRQVNPKTQLYQKI